MGTTASSSASSSSSSSFAPGASSGEHHPQVGVGEARHEAEQDEAAPFNQAQEDAELARLWATTVPFGSSLHIIPAHLAVAVPFSDGELAHAWGRAAAHSAAALMQRADAVTKPALWQLFSVSAGVFQPSAPDSPPTSADAIVRRLWGFDAPGLDSFGIGNGLAHAGGLVLAVLRVLRTVLVLQDIPAEERRRLLFAAAAGLLLEPMRPLLRQLRSADLHGDGRIWI